MAFIYKRLFFIAELLMKLTHNHVASPPSHQDFLFLCQLAFLPVLIISPLDVHKNTRGEGREEKKAYTGAVLGWLCSQHGAGSPQQTLSVF